MKIWMIILLILGLASVKAPVVNAQQEAAAPANEEQQLKEKVEWEKLAFSLLENVVNDAQLLRLPENRTRVQIAAGEMLWQRDQGRARSLFSLAAEGVAELMRSASANSGRDERRGASRAGSAGQLRQGNWC